MIILRSAREEPPWGGKPRIELGPALQQADALPTEPTPHPRKKQIHQMCVNILAKNVKYSNTGTIRLWLMSNLLSRPLSSRIPVRWRRFRSPD
jgi:hypothetical protein